MAEHAPKAIDLKKDRGLTIQWADGSTSYYTIAYLRKYSPSAESRQLREELASNPLAILPSSAMTSGGPLVAESAELVGNYALRINFSDGHSTGIYSWDYLREIDPVLTGAKGAPPPFERELVAKSSQPPTTPDRARP